MKELKSPKIQIVFQVTSISLEKQLVSEKIQTKIIKSSLENQRLWILFSCIYLYPKYLKIQLSKIHQLGIHVYLFFACTLSFPKFLFTHVRYSCLIITYAVKDNYLVHKISKSLKVSLKYLCNNLYALVIVSLKEMQIFLYVRIFQIRQYFNILRRQKIKASFMTFKRKTMLQNQTLAYALKFRKPKIDFCKAKTIAASAKRPHTYKKHRPNV